MEKDANNHKLFISKFEIKFSCVKQTETFMQNLMFIATRRDLYVFIDRQTDG